VIQVTRRYSFSASHRLHTPSLSEEENRLLYGKCNNPFGHGHNYVLDVSVRGPVDARSGRAVDPAELDRLVRDRVMAELDHRNLNEQIEEFQRIVPTTENLGLLIHSRLQRAWPSVFPGQWPRLEKVRIAETERNIFVVDAKHAS
jgi:6-pyruvoyltetrahydropterin/6-carboxytetrahydropterin synthase